jgi:hypothetical protein
MPILKLMYDWGKDYGEQVIWKDSELHENKDDEPAAEQAVVQKL